jgi:predicted transcriptional regulator
MKAVLISIQPKWCELIASKKKTVEVRKTKPKIDVPFKCYIYETKGKLRWCNKCKETDCERPYPNCACWEGQGKVIGEFVCNKMLESFLNNNDGWFVEKGCLTQKEIDEYQGDKAILCGWHISDLVIYDKPKELSEFYTIKCVNKKGSCGECEAKPDCIKPITRPPQSWCYVEERSRQ